ncbi:reverse transcriptase domain-containing protein [Cytophaga aurantiaca]|uniref:reverse transcriptase domain-containing protein n=1 Tax=Cytophaga aurantiaca TaxID=29530 RepID=UPI00035D046E|nr:reverse transcriptase domain-containing protein [Cytophaga aurantiaca]
MEFKEYYSRESIIKYLCKIRISYSSKRHKKQLLNNLVHKDNHLKKSNDYYDEEIIKQLNLLLPSRRQWLTHNSKTHIKCKNIVTGKDELKKINTDDKNKQILFHTIKRHEKNKSKYKYQLELDKFISEIENGIDNCSYKITTPNIIPEVKETSKSKIKYNIQKNKKIECRPISRFLLMDRIVISLSNKFLTNLLDNYFEDSALAFRAKKNEEEKNHHLAINKIIDFKLKNSSVDLFVAECDIKKFYDTVNHDLCFNLFENLLEKSQSNCNSTSIKNAKYIFKEYLNSYNFKDVVKSKESEKSYWEQHLHPNKKPINGKFPWIEKEISQNDFYKKNINQNIGVPQGGALSGLIANIMLDKADKKLKLISNLFYVRYCDDMILMHTDENSCKEAINIYKAILNDLLLFSHPFESSFYTLNKNYSSKINLIPIFIINWFKNHSFLNQLNLKFDKLIKNIFPNYRIRKKKSYNLTFKHSLKKFWNCKSKGPYRWGKLNIENNTFPWIGFVGYEIDYNGNIRIRKRSLKKEIDKQKRVITNILIRISKENFRHKTSRNNAIYRSALEKLNGMSVGRVRPYNYKLIENKICWVDGFRSLNFNKYSKIQLKKLDRHKYKFLNTLRHKIGVEKVEGTEAEFDTKNIYKLGKMFSYFFHAAEKKHNV